MRFIGTDSWGHDVLMEADPNGSGVKAADLVPIALATCAAYEMLDLRKIRQDPKRLTARISSDREPDPPWTFRSIVVEFEGDGLVDVEKAKRALNLAEGKYCSIAESLRPTVDIRMAVDAAARYGEPSPLTSVGA